MAETQRPKNENELQQIIANANSAGTRLEIIGHATKRGLGHRVNADVLVDMSMLSGITMYEPEELVMSAYAGTPLSEINSALGAKGQMLAFEPWNPTSIYGLKHNTGTIGGVFMGGFAGPRRISAGAPRDHLLGVNAVNGSGEIFKSGGRVVKNVSGFDIPKLMAGSFGTLAAVSSVSFKVLPRPQASRTVVVIGLDVDEAGKAMRQAMASPHEISATAYLPAEISGKSEIDELSKTGLSATLFRVEGPRPSAAHRAGEIIKLLSASEDAVELKSENSIRLWSEICDARLLGQNADSRIWRISVAPSDGPRVARWIEANINAEYFMDWSGGLVWIAINGDAKAYADKLRNVISGFGGHATLVRASDDEKNSIGVFNPLSNTLNPLVKKVKQSFDPNEILNPGRMGAEGTDAA